MHRALVPLEDREAVSLGLKPGAWVVDTRAISNPDLNRLLAFASPDLLQRIRAALLREYLARRSENLTEAPCP